jgi:hypothetical protein
MAGANGGSRKSGPTKPKGVEKSKMSYARRKQLEALEKAKAGAPAAKASASSGADLSRATPSQTASAVMPEARRIAQAGREVFISALHARVAPGMDLLAFKRKLVDAHVAGTLSLSRADMVDDMPRRSVDRSEVHFDGSTYHFVRVP